MPVEFVGINVESAVEQQGKLVEKCTFPLLQDTVRDRSTAP